MGQTAIQEEIAYPVIATSLARGFVFTAADFPAIQFECPDIYQGLQAAAGESRKPLSESAEDKGRLIRIGFSLHNKAALSK